MNIIFEPTANGVTAQGAHTAGSIDPRLSRTNYYDGQLLKASDLTRDQIYLDERLLEMGQVLGSGIARGLELTLVNNHVLRVQPGVAIAPSGRVLQLTDQALEINLQDSGVIADLNQGLYRRFQRGLYAVALRYAEVVDGVSESYPDSLNSRQWRVSSYAEGVELALLPLNITLPRGDELTVRAALARQIIGLSGGADLPTDEAIALGVIAIDQAKPLWLDLGLLRRPLRQQQLPNAQQLNLADHYRELFARVSDVRQQARRNDDFAATQYFRLLPPYGPLPKGSIDPVTGRQGYFPKDYDVAIAPVRRADLPTLLAESAQMAPMDLERDADADLMVLVPMDDQDFALRARQLEQNSNASAPSLRLLRQFNALTLRFTPLPPVHTLDTDAAVWQDIWSKVDAQELVYVRRPPRTAETNVSAIVLASGFALPAPSTAVVPSPANLEAQLDAALESSQAAQNALAQKSLQIDALNKQLKQLQDSLASNVELAQALEQVHTLGAALDQARQDIAQLQQTAQDAGTYKTALAAASDKITALSTELDQAHQQLSALQSQPTDEATLQKLKDLSDQLNSANQQIQTLQSDAAAQQVHLAESNSALGAAQTQITSLQQQLDAANANAAASATQLQAAQAQIAQLQDAAKQLNAQIQGLQTSLAQAQTARAAAEQASNDATLKLSDALKQTQDAQATLQVVQAQLDAANSANTDLQNKLASAVVLSTRLPLTQLAQLRGADAAAAKRLESLVGDNADMRIAALQLLVITPASADKALWSSLVNVASFKPTALPTLRDQVFTQVLKGAAIALAYLNAGQKLGMDGADLENWKALAG